MAFAGAGLGKGDACRSVGLAWPVCRSAAGVPAQFAMGVVSPGVRVALPVQSHGVAPARADQSESYSSWRVSLAWFPVEFVGGLAAQLADAVIPPGVEAAV